MASKPASFCERYKEVPTGASELAQGNEPKFIAERYASYDALTGVYTAQTRDDFMASLTADIERALASMPPIDLAEPVAKAPEAKAPETKAPETKAPEAKK
jgi:hypothetical protein